MSSDATTHGIAVVVPTWQGARYLPKLVAALRRQTLIPEVILVIDSSSSDGSAEMARGLGCTVDVIPQTEFNHGGTRNRAARATVGDIVVFLTQDALPDEQFIERITAPIRAGTVAATYARQIAYEGATPPEQMSRARNYPDTSQTRSATEAATLRVKAYFFSNVASAVSRAALEQVGGFPDDVIMNEDMVLCARLLQQGLKVAYCAEAVVRHSHNYTLRQQFRRYFDIGVFFTEHGHLLPFAATGGEGVRFAVAQIFWLLRRGHLLWALRSPWESAAKFIAFHLGRRYRLLPLWLVRRFSMHAFHFRVPQSR